MTLKPETKQIKPFETTSERSTRTQDLKKKVLNAPYEICIERARYYTQVFREMDGENPSLIAAEALKRTLENMTIYILPEELIVGNRSSKIVGSFIPIERGEFNIVLELDLKNIIKREVKPFHITPEDSREILEDIIPYWKKRSVRYYKGQKWKENNLMINPRFGPFSLPRRIWGFGFKGLWKSIKPLIKGRARHLFKGIKEVALNNPGLVNNVFDTQGHLVLGIDKVINIGFKGIKEKATRLKEKVPLDSDKAKFYESVIICCNAVKQFAERFSNLAKEQASEEKDERRKEELLQISKNLERVPWNPPQNFYEAIQFLWFTQDVAMISYGLGGIIAIGRPDQYLYTYYKKDLENGTLNKDFVIELLEELFIKLSLNLLILPSYAKASASELGGDNCATTIGGVDKNGNEATNDLSYHFLDAIANIKNMANSFSIRVSSKSPEKYLWKISEVFSKTSGPAIYNDDVIIPALAKSGYTLEDARDYGIIGCVEPASCGNTHSCTAGNDISLVGILEMTLNNGRIRMMGKRTGLKTGKLTKFKSFEEILKVYNKQLIDKIEFISKCVNLKDEVYMERFHSPLISSLFDGCLEKGMDMTLGGAKYNYGSITARGLATTADSLLAIKKAVFDEKWLTLKQLKKALGKNFRKHEALRQKLINKVPKYGNDNREADLMANWVAELFCDEVMKKESIRGGIFRPGFFSYGMNVFDGSNLSATPNGRRAGEAVSNSMSPSNGAEKNGPTALFNSYSKLNFKKMPNGCSLNLKLHPYIFKSTETQEKFVALLKSFIDMKNMHVQFNVVDNKTLLDAQLHPENHLDLAVRVSGYSAFFTDLGKPVQDDIIQRTQFTAL